MSHREFSTDDVIEICTQIAAKDQTRAQLPKRRPSLFWRGEEDKASVPRKSSIARKLSLVNGIPCAGVDTPESLVMMTKLKGKAELKKSQENKNYILGLRGRDVVAVAILCDENGAPFKTYTEHDDIPCEEIESAGKIFMSRVPSVEKCEERETTNENEIPLINILCELNHERRLKLMKKLDAPLCKLHTTDLNTATSFLKTERYAGVREEIKRNMIAFLTKELKITVYHSHCRQVTEA